MCLTMAMNESNERVASNDHQLVSVCVPVKHEAAILILLMHPTENR